MDFFKIKKDGNVVRIKILFFKITYKYGGNRFLHQIQTIQSRLHSLLPIYEYKIKHKKGDVKGVVYTCLTGDYDELFSHDFLSPEWDYVCFTDNNKMIAQKEVGSWKIFPLQKNDLGDHFNNRWHKLFPNLLFPKYKISVYIDSNINVLSSKLFDDIGALPQDCILAAPIHFERNCIYREAEACISQNKDTRSNIEYQMKHYREQGFPEQIGLAENNVIYRQHNDSRCIKIMKDWWDELMNYSKRDQLSLFYILWKNNMKIPYLSLIPYRFDYNNFDMRQHKGEVSCKS